MPLVVARRPVKAEPTPALKNAPPDSPQAGLSGWQADYPAASIFFALVSCSTADPSVNSSRFCSREFQAKLNRATVVQARDQGAAAKLWAEVDRDNTSLAAVVPTHTPTDIALVSKRVGNYQHHPLFGVLVDQLWVR